MRLGRLQIDVLKDGVSTAPASYFGDLSESHHGDMIGADGQVDLPIACFLVRTGNLTVLIDAGLGPHLFEWQPKPGETIRLEGGALPGLLAQAGVRPEEIDVVLPTHLHHDHAGWVVQNGVPYFPNATVYFGAGDWDAIVETHRDPAWRAGWHALASSGRARRIERDGEIVPGISALATPGHTPGHHCFVLSSDEERAMILGDIISCPLQIEYPEREALADMDRELGRVTRERVLRELDGQNIAVGGPHFPELRFGRIMPGRGRRYWA